MDNKQNISVKSLPNITHQLRTSIEIIVGNTKGVKNYLPILIDGYNKARDAGLLVQPIKREHLAILEGVLNDIKKETEVLFDTVETLNNIELLRGSE